MNNEIRNPKYERQGFTLVEMVVALGLLVIVILFAGVIFKASIGSYRVAMAQAEIMRKLRTITEQLDSDFKGLRKDAPLFIWFQLDPNDLNRRLDQIMFFADGDFQSTQIYNGKPIVGNLARINYSQAQSIDPRYKMLNAPVNLRSYDRLLARRQHISTADMALDAWPDPNNFATFNLVNNDFYEHDRISLSQWQALLTQPAIVTQTIDACLGANGGSRPTVDLANPNTLHMLMIEGVGSFSVQWSYMFTNAGQTFIYWWPSDDPDGNPATPFDSDFSRMPTAPFGFYFNVAAPSPSFTNWFSYGGALYLAGAVVEPIWPKALKFTFTLYDSRGVFKEGQTFTHIVYLGE